MKYPNHGKGEIDLRKQELITKLLYIWNDEFSVLNINKFMEKLSFLFYEEANVSNKASHNHIYSSYSNGIIHYEGSVVDMSKVPDGEFLNWLNEKWPM